MNKKTTMKRIMSIMLSVAFVCAMTFSVALSTVSVKADPASTANEAVNATKDAVVQITLVYINDDGDEIALSTGSAFLINEDHVVTCAHVVTLKDGDEDEIGTYQYYEKHRGISKKRMRDRTNYRITILRDTFVGASMVQCSESMDFAILKLNDPLQKNVLKLRSSADVKLTERVYAVGFPIESAWKQAVNTFTSDDVTITSGEVNKVSSGNNLYSGEITDYIQSSCNMTPGNSGGPMVDNDGNVIGICEGSTSYNSSDADDYFFSVAIDQVIEVLDTKGISYQKADGTIGGGTETETEDETGEETTEAPETDKSKLEDAIDKAESLDSKKYTPESYAKVTKELDAAKSVNKNDSATQEEIDDAEDDLNSAINKLEEAPSGIDNKMIIIIVVVVAAVLLVIIIIVVLASGKKKNKKPVNGGINGGFVPAQPPVQPGQGAAQPANQNNSPFTQLQNTEPAQAGETTLLNQGAGETTVLNSGAVTGGTLVSKKNGQSVQINAAEFIIGRERSKVNYCISGNSTIGRTHAKIVVRNGNSYLVDLRATNGTFLNGIKCTPMQEMPLKSGDVITFSDEDFEYQA